MDLTFASKEEANTQANRDKFANLLLKNISSNNQGKKKAPPAAAAPVADIDRGQAQPKKLKWGDDNDCRYLNGGNDTRSKRRKFWQKLSEAQKRAKRAARQAVRKAKAMEHQKRVSELPSEWRKWVKREHAPRKNFSKTPLWKLASMTRYRMGAEQHVNARLTKTKATLAVLEQAFAAPDFGSLVVATDDPAF